MKVWHRCTQNDANARCCSANAIWRFDDSFSWVIPKTSILFIYSSNLFWCIFMHFNCNIFNRTLLIAHFSRKLLSQSFHFCNDSSKWLITMIHSPTIVQSCFFYCERTLNIFSALSFTIYESYNIAHIMTHIYSSFCTRNITEIHKILNK